MAPDQQPSLSFDGTKRGVVSQFLLTPFGASWKQFIIAAAVTGMWFFLFWGPYASSFADLFPVSQWLWLPLLLILSGLAPMLFHHQFILTNKREKLFLQFAVTAKSINRSDIAIAYVYDQRTRDVTSDAPQLPELLNKLPESNAKYKLLRTWNLSLANEAQTHPYGMTTFAYICVWLFVLSVPFVYWSFYEGYGLLGLGFVTWPILAAIYGPLRKTNQFDNPDIDWFVLSNYEKRVRAYFSTAQQTPEATPIFSN